MATPNYTQLDQIVNFGKPKKKPAPTPIPGFNPLPQVSSPSTPGGSNPVGTTISSLAKFVDKVTSTVGQNLNLAVTQPKQFGTGLKLGFNDIQNKVGQNATARAMIDTGVNVTNPITQKVVNPVLENTIAPYAQHNVVEPLQQGIKGIQDKNILEALGIVKAGFSLTPTGLITNLGIGAGGGAINAARTGQNPIAGAATGATSGGTVSEGAGIKNPIVAFLVDAATMSPKSTLGFISNPKAFVKNLMKNPEAKAKMGVAGEKQVAKGTVAATETAAPVVQTVEEKITQALKDSKPLNAEQQALRTAEMSKRSGVIAKLQKQSATGTLDPLASDQQQLAALKGQLPNVQRESIASQITPADKAGIFKQIDQSGKLMPLEKVTARNAIKSLLDPAGVSLPTPSEIKILEQVFTPEFVKTLTPDLSLWGKVKATPGVVGSVAKELQSSWDFSAPLRQGIVLGVSHPKESIPAFFSMFKQAGSEKAFRAVTDAITSDSLYLKSKEAKLALTNISTGAEEAFFKNYAEKIPVVGITVKASNRAYTGFLNKLRFDTFKTLYNNGVKMGKGNDAKFVESLGSYINNATGRGELPKVLQGASGVLNTALYSPRLQVARVNMLNPNYFLRLDPVVRKQYFKDMLIFASTGATVLGLAKVAGADVGLDPRSADFMKIKVGSTRYDVLGGLTPYIRLAAQMASGQTVSSTTGKLRDLGPGILSQNRLDVLLNFFQNKESPGASFVTDLLKGTDATGKPINLPTAIVSRFVPMVIQDITDAVKADGVAQGIAKSIPGVFGVGQQTYTADPNTPTGALAKLQALPPDQFKTEALKLSESDPELFDKVLTLMEQKQAGITQYEESLSQYGVKPKTGEILGERAAKIVPELKKLSDNQAQKDYILKLYQGHIVTDDVLNQLMDAKQAGKW